MRQFVSIRIACTAAILILSLASSRCSRDQGAGSLVQHSPVEKQRPYEREEVSFQSGSVRLSGTLYVPRQGGSLPGIVLAHGRTEWARRQALFVVLAERLAARGYAVLSFDFRGFGESEDPPRIESPADLDFAGDLRSALDRLASTKRVDAAQLFLIGHSFGGGVVLRAAVDDPRVKKVISLSPPRRSYELFFDEQAKRKTQLRDEMMESMHLSPPVPTTLLYPVLQKLVPETLLGLAKHPPVLFVEGSMENDEDRAGMKLVFDQITPPKEYAVIEGAYHYYGTKRVARGPDSTKFDFQEGIVEALVQTIDRWLSGPGGPSLDQASHEP